MDFMAILRQAQEMKKTFDQAQAELEQVTVTGTAAGGMVSVDANGLGTVRKVRIDRSVVNPDDVEMLEDLIVVACGEAQRKAADEQKLRAPKLPDGMKLPF
jgi:DNA-binding YbaB/EbfC family protein